VSDAELLDDLRRIAKQLGQRTVGQKEYRRVGTYDDSTVTRRFGSWNAALLKAGLVIANQVDLPDEQLFDNIFTLWAHYGRQPRRRELALLPPRSRSRRTPADSDRGARPGVVRAVRRGEPERR
jgi:hypothetical protein